MTRLARAALAVLAFVAFALTWSTGARADESRRGGTVRLEPTNGGHGPIELRPGVEDTFSAEMDIINDGKEPLVVSRIAPRADPADPRVPPTLTARISEGSLPITIAPGTSRRATLQWKPDRDIRARQLFGHVVVTSSDERSGEVAMGVKATLPGLLGPLEPRLLSVMLLLPILGAIGALAAKNDAATSRTILLGALGVQTALAAYVYHSFVPELSRIDGNDGLQFIEHLVWVRPLGLEIFLGVDGIAVTALLATSLVALAAATIHRPREDEPGGQGTALLVLDAALVGALTSHDGMLFVLFVLLAVGASAALLGFWGGRRRKTAAVRFVVPALLATACLFLAVLGASRAADPTFLVDGTSVTRTFSLPELSRVALGAKDVTFLGAPVAKMAFALVLAAVVVLGAAFPLHRWLGDALEEASLPAGVLIATAFPTIALCALLRIGALVLPDGMRWASGVLVAIGAVTAAYGALAALGEPDLRRLAGAATTTQTGFALLGAGSLTPQGLSGAMVLGTTRIVAVSAFLILAGVAFDRAETTDTRKLGGLAKAMPVWTVAFGAAAFAQAGVLGLGGAWGAVLSLLGVLSSYAPLAVVAALALVVVAAAHLVALSRVAFGESELADAADLSGRERASVGPLVVIVIVLGLWPAPVATLTTGTVRDLANAVSPPGPDQVALND